MQNQILLIEDDPDHVLLVERALRKVRLSNPIRVMKDGEEAQACLAGLARDSAPLPMLILLDLKLPRLSGIELLRWIRSEEAIAKLPVAILTSSKENEDLHRAFDLGVDFYLIKPAAFDTVLDLLMVLDLPWSFAPSGKEMPGEGS